MIHLATLLESTRLFPSALPTCHCALDVACLHLINYLATFQLEAFRSSRLYHPRYMHNLLTMLYLESVCPEVREHILDILCQMTSACEYNQHVLGQEEDMVRMLAFLLRLEVSMGMKDLLETVLRCVMDKSESAFFLNALCKVTRFELPDEYFQALLVTKSRGHLYVGQVKKQFRHKKSYLSTLERVLGILEEALSGQKSQKE